MKNAALLLASLLLAACAIRPTAPERGVEYANGRWFDGRAFQAGSLYVADGRLATRRPREVTRVVDIAGGFVVPAFGEAHNHHVDTMASWPVANAASLKDGIYYLKNPNNVERLVRDVRPLTGKRDTIDVVFSHGGLTSATGHPSALYRMLLQFPAFRGMKPEDLADNAYYVVDTPEQLAAKWPAILAGKPDFLKAYLLHSEGHEKNVADAKRAGYNGLSPAMFALVVERARAAKLRVSVHVETAADFATAVAAGVDEINHLPGYMLRPGEPVERYQISGDVAREAARKKVTVVTTIGISPNFIRDAELLKRVQENQKRNLQLLHAAGVPIAIGSDNYMGTAAGEASYIAKLGIFDNATLLRLWTEGTAAAIFPGRAIGRIAEGYEADFLVLEGDPLADFANTARIRLRVKQGEALAIP